MPQNERIWVKFHFRTKQGIQNLTDAEAEALVGKDRETHQAICSKISRPAISHAGPYSSR